MAKVKNLCLVRDIYKALEQFERHFIAQIGLSIREAFVLCSLSDGALPAHEVASRLGALPSNTSKLVRELEDAGYIVREFGYEDKRKTFFSLTDTGRQAVLEIQKQECDCPDILKPLLDRQAASES